MFAIRSTAVIVFGAGLGMAALPRAASAQTPCSQCYADCNGDGAVNVADFSCFLAKYGAGDPYANCDGSTAVPTLNVADFSCFLTKYNTPCPASEPTLHLSGVLPTVVWHEGDIEIDGDAYLAGNTTITARNGKITITHTVYGVLDPANGSGLDGDNGGCSAGPTQGHGGASSASLTLITTVTSACSADVKISSGGIDLHGYDGGKGGGTVARRLSTP